MNQEMAMSSSHEFLFTIKALAPFMFECSAAEILEMTDDADPGIQTAALIAADELLLLGGDPRFAKIRCRIAATDSHELPRHHAIYSLMNEFQDTGDRVVQNALAKCVRDEDAPTDLRNYAYGAIVVIEHGWEGDFEYCWEQLAAEKARVQLPLRQIDWGWLDTIEAEATADQQ